jgi:SAM-dependent methyltransferase
MTSGGVAPGRPLVFTGRHRQVNSPGTVVVDDREATPRRILPLLNRASALVLLDPLSFPYEVLRPVDRDVPVAASLPPLATAALEALLGEPLLNHLGPGDRVAAYPAAWEELAQGRRWGPGMRLGASAGEPAAVAAEALVPGALGSRSAKEEGRRRAQALAHLLRGMDGWWGGAGRVLDAGGKAGPWRHLLPGGLEPAAAPAAAPWPAAEESVEAAVALGVLGGLAHDDRRALVGEMWRVVRPGGVLAVVDDVVPIPRSGRACPFLRGGLPRLLLEATGRRVVLGRVWSMRFPGEPLPRGAGVSVIKVGEARRW